jgi:hypothetical protein
MNTHEQGIFWHMHVYLNTFQLFKLINDEDFTSKR